MPISESEDDARIETLQRWLANNRDPGDEHWRCIEAALHRCTMIDPETNTLLDNIARENEEAIGRLDDEIEDLGAQLDLERQRSEWLEKVARAQARLLEKIGKTGHVEAFEKGVAAVNAKTRRAA